MYKVIVVDDEEDVRVGIVQKTDWQQYGFFVAGQAENGREALDLIEDDLPDVVITDITMPLMDGLELASILRDRFPLVKTVILTGFDEFKFAQQAIRYGVVEYLLKPVLPADINDLMEKLKDMLDSEFSQREDMDRLRRFYRESLPVMKNKFLSSLVTGKIRDDEIEEKAAGFSLRLAGNSHVAAVARIDGGSLRGSAFEGKDRELADIAVLDMARDILGRRCGGEAFFHEGLCVFLVPLREQDGANSSGEIYAALEEIRQSIEKYLSITVTVGIGSVARDLGRARNSYREACAAADYSVVLGGNRVIYLEDVERSSPDTVEFDEEKEHALTSAIKFGPEKEVTAAVDSLFKELIQSKTAYPDSQLYLMEMLAAALRTARAYQLDAAGKHESAQGFYRELSGFSSLTDARDWFTGVCVDLMRKITGKRQNSAQVLMDKARDYISANYHDNSLSLQKLADHLHISACYLSMIFKKLTGGTFLKYLVRVRLEAAKELLATTELKSTEIAERIGYPDINYFSYFFKKNYGMSPREYRASAKKPGV